MAEAAIDPGEHRLRLRVYYEDTDAAGLVYHANHLRFAERARTEMLRSTGIDHIGLRTRFGLTFAVRRCVIDFLAPGHLDDLLEVRTRSVRIGGASLDLEQRILRDELLLARLDVRLALISATGRPARVPRELIDGLAPLAANRPVRA
jgi:acyl-CoA thioester hydrolase